MTNAELELLREHLELDPTTPSGLRWIKSTNGRIKPGQPVGSTNSDGYYQFRLKRKHYKCHRVILLLNGITPPDGCNRSFSESDFFSKTGTNTILDKEIPRIKRLRKAKQLDHYMLFANRRLTGNAEAEIRDYIALHCEIPSDSIYLCGVEQLELWLKVFSDVVKAADLDPVDSPLIVSPDDLAEVVLALARNRVSLNAALDDPPTPRVSYEEKNAVNNMTVDYAKEQRRRYLKETAQIHTFLAAPENIELLRTYESVVDEFQLKIISKRKNYQTFDEVMEYLVDLLFSRDAVLRQRTHKRLTRLVLFYMYWNCDIGEVGNA